jgi:glycine/D-amino acid oxidase-like deaminating enzyme
MPAGSEIPPDAGRAWWLRDALAVDPGEPCPRLAADTAADVVILGGGYTGMWTAFHLNELQPDLDVVLLEQDICGGGASGRNGGFVNSWWSGIDDMAQRLGDHPALALCRAGEESVASIGRFCEDNRVDAWFHYDGDLGVASSPAQSGEWADLVITAERLGVGEDFRVLSPAELREQVDSPVFHGGISTKHGATVQPARLARGLRRVLLERGVRIHEETPVTRFGAGDPVVVETPGGRVRAGSAVIGLNAWAMHWKAFRRVITVRGSYIVLTAPAPEKLAEINWTDFAGVWDFRSSLHYVRTTPDGRISFGIGGVQPGLFRSIGPRFSWDEHALRIAVADLHRMFPTFADVPIEAGWGGPIDVSGQHWPFFGTMGKAANVHYGLGYTGNGVGPAHLGGKILAHKVLANDDPVLQLPLVDMEPKRFPPEPIRSPGALIANTAIHRKDATEDEGEEPNPFVDFVARLPRRLGYNLGP